MKLQKIARVLLISISAYCVTACNYLDVVPPETADYEHTMKDENAVRGFLYSCYAGIPTGEIFFYNYLASVDEYVIPQKWGYACLTTAYGNVTSSSAIGPWYDAYNNIGQCNLFLSLIEQLQPSDVSNSQKEQFVAEVKFCRAYYHYQLLFNYGPCPIMETRLPQTTPKEDFPARATFDECVETICRWLDDAADVLPVQQTQDNLGRASKMVCKALKARILLYAASRLWNGSFPYPNWANKDGRNLVNTTYDRSKWERALKANIEALELAVNEGGRELFDLTTSELIRKREEVPLPNIPGIKDEEFLQKVVQMQYLMTTTEFRDGNKELIWGTKFHEDQQKEIAPHYILSRNNGNRVGGYSGMNPIMYTIEHFYTKNGELPEYDSDFAPKSQWLQPVTFDGQSSIVNLHANREPRFYAWIGFDGGEYASKIVDGQPLVLNMRSSNLQGFNEDMYDRDNSPTGYLTKKWNAPNLRWRKSDGGSNKEPMKRPLIRLAELYLNLAECYAELEDEENALKNLNAIRKRAGIKELESTDITSEMPLIDWVRNERFVELWGEQHRYYDLRRWTLAPDYLKVGTRVGLNAMRKDPSFEEFYQRFTLNWGFKWFNRMYLLPIPPSELYANPQLVQAPGY